MARQLMTYACDECEVRWHPYQCVGGVCPGCGGGTRREQEPASEDVDERFKAAMRARRERERREHDNRLRVDDEKRLSAAMVTALEDLLRLPACDPETGLYQHGEAA